MNATAEHAESAEIGKKVRNPSAVSAISAVNNMKRKGAKAQRRREDEHS
mgnify:CR=1 FL=1